MAATYGGVPLFPPDFSLTAGAYTVAFHTTPPIGGVVGMPVIITSLLLIGLLALGVFILEGLQLLLAAASP
jgi:hypothetical protein